MPLTVPGWAGLDWLWHGFSTRTGGVSCAYSEGSGVGELNLGYSAADTAENVRENRRRFVERITGSGETRLVTLRQVHSNKVAGFGAGYAEWALVPEADGAITRQSGVLLGIQTADCIPVLVVDPVRRAVGGFHAGWRGTVERIVELGVGQMQVEFGSDPSTLMAAIGPGIGGCCYAVGTEVVQRFGDRFTYATELFKDGVGPEGQALSDIPVHLDLIEANRRQLLDAGLPFSSIAVVGGCTACHPELFYSHRASGGHAGRMMAVVGIRS